MLTKIFKQAHLVFIGGGSDKVYQAQIVELEDGYLVNFQYGRRGSTLTAGTKTTSAVSQAAAQKIYDKLISEKRGKGYNVPESFGLPPAAENTGESSIPVSTSAIKTSFGYLPQLLNEITEDEALRLLRDDDYIVQEKHDGERRMVSKDAQSEIRASNRKGEVIPTAYGISNGLAAAPPCVIDGEHVGEIFVIFDMLEINGQSLSDLPYILRRKSLEAIVSNQTVRVVKTAFTKKEKTAMFELLRANGKEGVVFKRNDATYTPGRPNSGGDQLKFKFYATATCRVRTVNAQRSVEIELKDAHNYIAKGNVTVPPNQAIPAVGELIEVRYLYAYPDEGSLYQPTFVRVRNDIECDNVNTLKFKPSN